MAEVGRLALRVEGNWWIAYYAKADTMENAIEMGRIAMPIVENKTCREAFKTIMTTAIADLLKNQFGEIASWNEKPAPEHERMP